MKHLKNIFIAILITIFPLIFLFLPIIFNYSKSGSNTFLLGREYSHLSRDEIISRINQDFILPQNINLEYNQQIFPLNLDTIPISINSSKTASKILYRRLDEGIVNYVKYFFNQKDFNLNLDYDSDQLDQQLEAISSQIDQPFVPTQLIIDKKDIKVDIGTTGLSLDQSGLKEEIISSLSSGSFNKTISLTTNSIGTIPSLDQINQTVIRARKLIGKSINLLTDLDNTTIDDQTLISWLGFNQDFDQEKILSYSQNLSNSLQRPPVDAVFKFEQGQVIEFQPAKNGLTLNASQLSQEIISTLSSLEVSEETNITTKLSYQPVFPKIKNSDVNDLGIVQLLGSGTSTFKNSSNTRNINIVKGASIINRILVAPGDTFSFVKSLGEVSLEAGYTKAYIIRQGRTELDVGGGICQVSTTLFRAMLNSGLNITERKAHAYRVSYYEEDSQPGFDATVFIPNPDLKFINDTGHYLLIQSLVDIENRRLTYEIYGTSDGRKVAITNYRQWGYAPPPPTVWIDDPTLPVGKVIKDETAVPGLKTSFDWTVTDANNQILHQKTFTSSFVPWAAVYRRGPTD